MPNRKNDSPGTTVKSAVSMLLLSPKIRYSEDITNDCEYCLSISCCSKQHTTGENTKNHVKLKYMLLKGGEKSV